MLTQEEILKYLKEYKSLKKDEYHIKRLGVFGSYARNEASENSDIDIVVDFEEPDLFNKKVDVVALWKHMNPKLLTRI